MSLSKNSLAKGIFLFCTAASAAVTLLVLVFMFLLGLPLLEGRTFYSLWGEQWEPHAGLYGILPMVAGTLWIALLAACLSLPLSLGAAGVMTSLGGPGVRRLLQLMVRFMTGIPTVIYGFAAIFLLVPFMRQSLGGAGLSVLTAGMVLAILISPTMILFMADSLAAVDPAHVQAARALGASRVQRLLYVKLPQALPGMVSGFVLGLGRALGDTLIALMLAGNAIAVPGGFLAPARTLTAHIALVKAADFNSPAFRSIFACGIILYLFTTAAVLCVRLISHTYGEAGRA